MKSIAELGILAGIAVTAGLGNWLVSGRPSADPVKELREAPLTEGEVLLEQLLAAEEEAIVWIDARPADQWSRETKPGAVNISMQSGEPLGDQLARHFEVLLNASHLVIFCDDMHCSVSHDLAAQLKSEAYRDFVGGEVLVLRGGMTALRAAGQLNGSNPGP